MYLNSVRLCTNFLVAGTPLPVHMIPVRCQNFAICVKVFSTAAAACIALTIVVVATAAAMVIVNLTKDTRRIKIYRSSRSIHSSAMVDCCSVSVCPVRLEALPWADAKVEVPSA